MLDSKADSTRDTTPEWAAAKGSKGRPLPRLHKNVFLLDYGLRDLLQQIL